MSGQRNRVLVIVTDTLRCLAALCLSYFAVISIRRNKNTNNKRISWAVFINSLVLFSLNLVTHEPLFAGYEAVVTGLTLSIIILLNVTLYLSLIVVKTLYSVANLTRDPPKWAPHFIYTGMALICISQSISFILLLTSKDRAWLAIQFGTIAFAGMTGGCTYAYSVSHLRHLLLRNRKQVREGIWTMETADAGSLSRSRAKEIKLMKGVVELSGRSSHLKELNHYSLDQATITPSPLSACNPPPLTFRGSSVTLNSPRENLSGNLIEARQTTKLAVFGRLSTSKTLSVENPLKDQKAFSDDIENSGFHEENEEKSIVKIQRLDINNRATLSGRPAASVPQFPKHEISSGGERTPTEIAHRKEDKLVRKLLWLQIGSYILVPTIVGLFANSTIQQAMETGSYEETVKEQSLGYNPRNRHDYVQDEHHCMSNLLTSTFDIAKSDVSRALATH
eukprot:jgi/Bigna1/79462/fgenesh1_pg.62_\